MLSFALVLIVGMGSIGLYLAAYIYPEIYRKTDIWWSGIGLFYALSLLIYRRPLGLLLGHTASVILLVGLSYQALQRRWAMVGANPPQPKAGTLSAQARAVVDQIVAKVVSVDWQGLWQKMGTQANDGTSEKSILPPTLKERLNLSGLGAKLKGMIGGKRTSEVSPPAETVQSTTVSTPVASPSPPTSTTPAPPAEVVAQPTPVAEPVPPEQQPAPPVEPNSVPEMEQISTMPDPSVESPISQESDAPPALEVEAVVEVEPTVQPEDPKAELEAELDQVISDLSPEEKEGTPNLPPPPDPLA